MTMYQRALIIAIACAVASPAFADPKADLKAQMDAAAVAYKEGRYDDTLVALNKAYAIDPRPELRYSIGQVYVKLGRCGDAILAYETFLASKPSPDRADLANQAIETCKAQQAQQPVEPVVKPPPPIVAPAPAPVDTPPVWWKDKVGLGLAGGGAVVTIVGIVLYARARGTANDAANADDYNESQSLYDDAKTQRTTAVVVTVAGVAAMGVGAWWLWRKRGEERRGVAFVPAADGGMITYAGGF